MTVYIGRCKNLGPTKSHIYVEAFLEPSNAPQKHTAIVSGKRFPWFCHKFTVR